MKISKRSIASSDSIENSKSAILSADAFDDDSVEDFDADPALVEDDNSIVDSIDELSDNIEDLQDQVDDIQEDRVDIEVDNNIADHYIAECSACHGIFISAVVESDQQVDKIYGICPLCDSESEQYLRWVIKSV